MKWRIIADKNRVKIGVNPVDLRHSHSIDPYAQTEGKATATVEGTYAGQAAEGENTLPIELIIKRVKPSDHRRGRALEPGRDIACRVP